MDAYFITDIRTKNVFLKKSIINVGISNCYRKDLRSAGKLASASRLSGGRPSLTSTVKEPLKKRRMPRVPDPSNNTRFDELDHFPVFQEKQQRCRKRQTGYPFKKFQKCGTSLCLQNVRSCFTIYATER